MSPSPIAFADVFAEIESASGIQPGTVEAVFAAILAGEWTPPKIAGFLAALRLRGETPAQIAAAARALRRAMVPVDHGLELTLDTCGTGGDGRGTVNLSTGAAIVAAACGVPVAKHGNRAVSSRSGSADVLEALGIPLDVPPSAAAGLLRQEGIAFLLAPAHHPAMRFATPVRRELGIRTVFNILGPLANPAAATHQLLGTYDDRLRPVLAETLRELGSQRAWVVRGADGLDEISPYGPTRVTELDRQVIRELEISPADFGLKPSPTGAADGDDPATNADAIRQVLAGEDHPARTGFVLNAAAALVVAKSIPPSDATQLVEAAIASGSAQRKLSAWRAAAQAARVG